MVLVGQRRAGLLTVAYISACIVCAPLISRDDTDLASVITGLMHGDPVFSHTTVTVVAVCFLKALSCPRCLLDLFRPRPEQRSRPVRHAPAVLCALCAPLAHSSPHRVTLYPRPRAKGDTSLHKTKKNNSKPRAIHVRSSAAPAAVRRVTQRLLLQRGRRAAVGLDSRHA